MASALGARGGDDFSSLNGGPTALDGTWKTSYTKADLIAWPFLDDPGTINDGNWATSR